MNHAQTVRDAAQALHAAITAAESEGHQVQWPRRAAELPAIAVSEVGAKATIRNIDGSPVHCGPDGLVHADLPKVPARKKSAPDAA